MGQPKIAFCERARKNFQEERGEKIVGFAVLLTVDPPNRRGPTHQCWWERKNKKICWLKTQPHL